MSHNNTDAQTLEKTMLALGARARHAATALALADSAQKNACLQHAADNLRANASDIIAANARDMKSATASGVNDARLDRIMIDAARVENIAKAVEDIIALPDPIGETIAAWQVKSGLAIERRRVPLGVIGIIYESRPNVTADAAALCLKAGNAAILRNSSEIVESANLIHRCFHEALISAGLDAHCVQIVPTSERAAVGHLLQGLDGQIDVIVPRGGRGLVERVQQEARVPVFAHLEGICHAYVHGAADTKMAHDVVINAKLRRTGICGAAETLLVDKDWGQDKLRDLLAALLDAGCALRGDDAACAAEPRLTPASEQDWHTEYLDAIMAVRVVGGIDDAIAHIARYGSAHTETIITADEQAAQIFLDRVDSAIVMHNCSTQFADGGEFGMGAELGIATGRFHARGPVGLEQLTSFKYVVRGQGQTRPL